MKFLHIVLSLLMVATSTSGLASDLVGWYDGQAQVVQQDGPSGHDCCDEPDPATDQDCCDSPTCGQCHTGVVALAITSSVCADFLNGPAPSLAGTGVAAQFTTPLFRPPIS